MTLEQLKRACEDSLVDSTGLKAELVDRLVDYHKPEGGWPRGTAGSPRIARSESIAAEESGSRARFLGSLPVSPCCYVAARFESF